MLNSVNEALRRDLKDRLPGAAFPDLGPDYLEEPRGRYHGIGGVLVAPATAAEVAEVVRQANIHRVPILPYAGGTGLVGGQIVTDGPEPIILSLRRMNRIRATYPSENVLIAEAGVILADVQAAAAAEDLLFPLSLASEGSARIGGLLATNAGGVNVLRYGNARDLCLGVEAVLPNGEIWNGLSRLRKDNMGYDLRHLMIGSEGTLGVITAAALALSPRPRRTGVACLAVRDPAAALDLLARSRDLAGETVSAFELIHQTGLRFLRETLPQVRQPFAEPPGWSVLIELGGGAGFDPEALLEQIFADGYEAGLIEDGVIAQSQAQADALWAMRENIPEANRLIGAIVSTDVSLPLSRIADFVETAEARLTARADVRINAFGHLGDGNLHFNIFPPEGRSRDDCEPLRPEMTRIVHDLVQENGGSVSAEHGVGRLKVGDLERYGDPAFLGAIQSIKAALDPNGIMNPGAVLRAQP